MKKAVHHIPKATTSYTPPPLKSRERTMLAIREPVTLATVTVTIDDFNPVDFYYAHQAERLRETFRSEADDA